MKKILIWIGCLLPVSIFFTAIESNGYMLNPLLKTLIAASAVAVAIKICKTLKVNNTHEQVKKPLINKRENIPLPNECPACFHKISQDDKECSYCGRALKQEETKKETQIEKNLTFFQESKSKGDKNMMLEKSNKMTIEELANRLSYYQTGITSRAWSKTKVLISFENEYIKVRRLDSSNKWLGIPHKSDMEKMWSIIIDLKKDFRTLSKYRELHNILDIKLNSVTKGELAGCYGLRIYGMKKEPNSSIIYDILNYIFA